MEHPLVYNPHREEWEVWPPMWLRKGALINDISIIQDSLGKGCVDEVQFDVLFDMELCQLERIVNDQACQLDRARARLRF